MQSRIAVIGVVLFAIILALFAFTQQQQAAQNEATAVAAARAAGTLQSEADTARETAVGQAERAATAQANALQGEATAVAQAHEQATAQAQAEYTANTAIAQAALAATALTDAEQAEASAIAQANTLGTVQAESLADQGKAEASRSAAVSTAQAGATEVGEQAATAEAALTSSSRNADTLSTYESQSTQNALIGATAIAGLQADATSGAEAAKTAVARIEATTTAQLEMTATAYQELVTQIWETSRELDAQRTQTATAPTTVPVAGTPYPVPNLTQNFTYSDGSFSLRYPRRWIADELPDSTMTLSSSQQAGLLLFGTVEGEMYITTGAYSEENMDGIPLDALIAGGREAFDQSLGSAIVSEYTEVETFQLGEYEAYHIIGRNKNFDVELVIYEKDGGIIFLLAICGAGEINLCQPMLYAIAETITYHNGQT